MNGGAYARESQNGAPHINGFSDSDIKELSYDIGVDPRILKYKL